MKIRGTHCIESHSRAHHCPSNLVNSRVFLCWPLDTFHRRVGGIVSFCTVDDHYRKVSNATTCPNRSTIRNWPSRKSPWPNSILRSSPARGILSFSSVSRRRTKPSTRTSRSSRTTALPSQYPRLRSVGTNARCIAWSARTNHRTAAIRIAWSCAENLRRRGGRKSSKRTIRPIRSPSRDQSTISDSRFSSCRSHRSCNTVPPLWPAEPSRWTGHPFARGNWIETVSRRNPCSNSESCRWPPATVSSRNIFSSRCTNECCIPRSTVRNKWIRCSRTP